MDRNGALAARLFILLALTLMFTLAVAGVAHAQGWTDINETVLSDYDITAGQLDEISEGYADGSWRPYEGMTRAQFVKMAVEAFGLQLVNPATPTFQDIPVGHQYYSYIETAYVAGMITGVGDGYFSPDRVVTRSQGAAIIVRYMAELQGITVEQLYSTQDIDRILAPYVETRVEIGEALAAEMAAAIDWGVLRGTAHGHLNPGRFLQRIQGAALLIRAETPQTEDVEVSLYFTHDGLIAPVHRTVVIGRALEIGAATLEQLFLGLNQGERADLVSEIPQGTDLISLDIQNGVATADLDSDFLVGDDTDASLKLRLAQLVYTLTQFDSVDAVSLMVAGEALNSMGGVDLSQPLGRSTGVNHPLEEVTPAILVESPVFYDEITSAVRVHGSANVFEATFILEVRDENDQVLAEEVVTATSGTGDRGTFDVTVSYPQPATQTGAVVVYSESARDGSPENVVRVPVTFGDVQ